MTPGLVLLSLAALGYLAAAAGFQWNLFRLQERDWQRWRTLLWASFLTHSLALGVLTFSLGHVPLSGMAESLGSLAWVVVALYLFLGQTWKMDVLGTVAAPAAFAMTAFSILAMGTDTSGEARHGIWFYLHVGSLLLGYAAFFLAGFCALLYFIEARLLKQKRLTGIFTLLPSLDSLDRAAYRLILAGFPLMVLGITTGMVLSGWTWNWADPKMNLVLVTGLVYLGYLHVRLIAGWQGRRVNLLLLIAFVCVLVSFLSPGRFHRF
ncbi:MAG: cytochrome c biogenesis protein CcsA [Candidatus Eremiobacterota bacterium]